MQSTFGRVLATRARQWILAVTLLLGVLIAVAVATALPAGERTLAIIAFPTHMIVSVVLPFLGVLLGRDLVADPSARAAPVLGSAVGVAAGVAVLTDLVIVAALAATGPEVAGAWDHAALVLLGGLLVQPVANLTGTGLGVLIRPAWVACLATIVIPLGVWALLGLAGPFAVVREWITPFPVAGTLLSGEVGAVDWARFLVVALIWGVGLNAVAVRQARARRVPAGRSG
ncbi:hypothetical protein [Catenuloplanes japonicus]|uniref:hypothetical protein n=1 Tax=Catenuloplanes japonicus TaxID=33876 RepID=UPI0012FB6344|nr:hypothetical protein [Catenuloplanes japonicus]